MSSRGERGILRLKTLYRKLQQDSRVLLSILEKSVIRLAIFYATVYNWAHGEAEAIQAASS